MCDPQVGLPAQGGTARKIALSWLAGYMALSGALALGGHYILAATIHALGVLAIAYLMGGRNQTARVLGGFVPLVVAPALYVELPLLIAAVGSQFHDALVQRWELALFGGYPSIAFARAIPSRAVGELLHAGYLAYYPALFLPAVVLYATRRMRGFSETVLAVTVTCTVCWMIYVFFPVEGPRYLWMNQAFVPDGPFRRLAVGLLAAGSSRGAAFPSSHMAVSVVQASIAWRWQSRPMAAVLTIVAALVGLGAVYGGFHYATDIVAGALLGGVISALLLTRPGPNAQAGKANETRSRHRVSP